MGKLTSADIARISIQTDMDSPPVDDNFQTLKDAHNETDTRVDNIVSTGTIVEVSDARPYHTVLKNRLDSKWKGQYNFLKYGGAVVMNSDGDKVDVTAGEATINGTDVLWGASTSGAIALAAATTRYDVVVIQSDSTLAVVTGAESADPVLPSVPVTKKALAILLITTTTITVLSDARSQGAYYHEDGAVKYEWKVQDAIDDITTSGEIYAGPGRYYEELDFTGKSNITLRCSGGANIYRISDTNYCIKSINTVSNETTGIKVYEGNFFGNSKAGSLELFKFTFTDEFIIDGCRYDGNALSTATYKNGYISDCDNFYFVKNKLFNSNGDIDNRTVFIFDSSDTNILVVDEYISYWKQVGNDLNIAGVATHCSITALSSTRIAFVDTGNADLRTYDFDGTDWAQVGNDLNIAGLAGTRVDITALSSSRIAYFDIVNDDLRVYDFDGTDWAQVGNDLNIVGAGGNVTLAALSSSRIAYLDAGHDDLRTYDFDGTDWSQTGNDLNIPGITVELTMAALTSSRIALIEDNNQFIRTYDFDGTDWSQISRDSQIISLGSYFSIAAFSSETIAFFDTTNNVLRKYFFNGVEWVQYGSEIVINGVSNDLEITVLKNNMIAWIDITNDDLRTYKYDYTFSDIGAIPPSPVF